MWSQELTQKSYFFRNSVQLQQNASKQKCLSWYLLHVSRDLPLKLKKKFKKLDFWESNIDTDILLFREICYTYKKIYGSKNIYPYICYKYVPYDFFPKFSS